MEIDNFKKYGNNIYGKGALRNDITPKHVNQDTEWVLKTPKDIRAAAVFEAHANRQACQSNLEAKNIKHYKLGFMVKKKKLTWTIDIAKTAIDIKNKRNVIIYPTFTNKTLFKLTEDIVSDDSTGKILPKDCKIHFDGTTYFLIIPSTYKPQIFDKKSLVCSLDPGVRTFQTLYNPEDEVAMSIGDEAANRIELCLWRLDSLLSVRDKATGKQKKKVNMKARKLRRRIKNLQSELHHKVSTFLCKNYHNIVIPHFKSGEMAIRVKKCNNCKINNIERCKKCIVRKLRKRTVRQMMILGHCKFLELLKFKAKKFSSNIIIQEESYTSKTCGNCLTITDIGSVKEWKCPKCSIHWDRDVNGARNILFKNFEILNFKVFKT